MECNLCFEVTIDNSKNLENVSLLKWAEIILKNINVNYIAPFRVCQVCFKHLKDIHDFCEYVEQRRLANGAAIKLEKESFGTLESDEINVANIKVECTAEYVELLAEQSDCDGSENANAEDEAIITEAQELPENEDADEYIAKNTDGNELCKVCNKKFISKHALKGHVVRVHLKRKFTCQICRQEFHVKREFLRHVSEAHKNSMEAVKRTWSLAVGTISDKISGVLCQNTYDTEKPRNHHQNHNQKNKYFCDTCGMGYPIKLSLELHIAQVHDKEADNEELNDRSCIICKKLYKNVEALRYHMRTIHPDENPYPCKLCCLKFNNNMAFRKHYESVHCQIDSQGYSPEDRHCIICSIGFVSMRAFRMHMETNHKGQRPFACDLCEVRYQTRSSLRRHVENSCKNRKYNTKHSINSLSNTIKLTANVDNKLSTDNEYENRNLNDNNIKNDKEKLSNDIGNTAVNADSNDNEKALPELPGENEGDLLNKQLNEAEDGECFGKDFATSKEIKPISQIKTKRLENFKNRLKTDAVAKSFVKYDSDGKPTCSFCNKTGESFLTLCSHIAFKHLQRKGICKTCGKEFRFLRDLQRHIKEKHSQKISKKVPKIKTDDYDCDFCQTKFKTHHALQIHLARIHDNKHTCVTCGIAFSKKSNLELHIARGHKDEETEASDDLLDRTCGICKKIYKTLGAVRSHMKQIHPNEYPFPCSNCVYKFKDYFQYRNHYNKVHKDPDPNGDRHCVLCNISFCTTKALRTHMEKTHKGVRPFACDLCSSKYSLRSSYQRHIDEFCSARKKLKRMGTETKSNESYNDNHPIGFEALQEEISIVGLEEKNETAVEAPTFEIYDILKIEQDLPLVEEDFTEN